MKIVIDLEDDIVNGVDGFGSVEALEDAIRNAVSSLETSDGDTIYLGCFSVSLQDSRK